MSTNSKLQSTKTKVPYSSNEIKKSDSLSMIITSFGLGRPSKRGIDIAYGYIGVNTMRTCKT